MKNTCLFIILLVFAISCSSREESSAKEVNYFPIKDLNEWTYTGASTSKFSGTETSSGVTFNKLLEPKNIFGFTGNSILVRKSNNEYYFTGTLPLNNESVSISNKLFFNENAVASSSINDFTETTSPVELPFSESGITGKAITAISYRTVITIGTTKGSLTVNNKTYTDVTEVIWEFRVKANTKITSSGLTLADHPLVPEAKIGTLKQYFANGVGAVKTELSMDGSRVTFNKTINLLGNNIDISNYVQALEQQVKNYKETNSSTLMSYTLK